MTRTVDCESELKPGGFVRLLPTGRTTRRVVLIADKAADWGITIGGLLVIVAVFGILVFLGKEVVPLFAGGESRGEAEYSLAPMTDLLWVNADEYQTIGVRISASGRVESFHLDTGAALTSTQLDFGGETATAVGATINRSELAFGFADGRVRFARVALEASVIPQDRLPTGLRRLNERDMTDGSAVFRPVPGNQIRRVAVGTSVQDAQQIAPSGTAIRAINVAVGGTVERPTQSFVTVDAEGIARLTRTESRMNLMTGSATLQSRSATLPELPPSTDVSAVLLTGQGDQVYVATPTGIVFRFDTRDFGNPVMAERAQLTDPGVRLTAFEFLIGDQTLLTGGSDGSVRNYFRLQASTADTADGYRLVLARTLDPQPGAVVAKSMSQRRKSLVTVAAGGQVWFRHATSEQVLMRFQAPREPGPGTQVMLMPRDDGIMILDPDGTAHLWKFSLPHPETTVRSVFGKVWYEGYPEPTYTWQSSSGTDVFEPKLSLVPLIFGTLKATVYSLMFALPIALLAAVYTSEFVHRRVRATVKPIMEMMESLPTVVLGFVAALILAPIVESWIAAVVLGFVILPLGLMLAAYLWQMLPTEAAIRYGGVPKFLFMFIVIFASAWSAYRLGPEFEQLFFYGDFKAWTDGALGTGTPFMGLILWPLSLTGVVMALRRTVGTRYRLYLRTLEKTHAARIDAARWVLVLALSLAVSFIIANLLTAIGFDPRGGIVDTYSQRNALVVGMVMGFAVIPNIYTLAEDSLNAVPSHLRAASLAAGATPWQTAMWVVLPTAMSGVFAACMIGMGRAVGETMIVVMAAGNTPVLDWNIFSGLRTLSANIAVELPEAVVDGTLYRMLFLAALTLFILTFVINTMAEIIRQRFRKRAFQL